MRGAPRVLGGWAVVSNLGRKLDLWTTSEECGWCDSVATRETIDGDFACEWHDHQQSYPVAWCEPEPRPMTDAERARFMDALRKWAFPTQVPTALYGVRRS